MSDILICGEPRRDFFYDIDVGEPAPARDLKEAVAVAGTFVLQTSRSGGRRSAIFIRGGPRRDFFHDTDVGEPAPARDFKEAVAAAGTFVL